LVGEISSKLNDNWIQIYFLMIGLYRYKVVVQDLAEDTVVYRNFIFRCRAVRYAVRESNKAIGTLKTVHLWSIPLMRAGLIDAVEYICGKAFRDGIWK
jgi:hypothetical protein